MAETIETISAIKTSDGVVHPLEASVFGGRTSDEYQLKSNITTTITSGDNAHYPTINALYQIVGDITSLRN